MLFKSIVLAAATALSFAAMPAQAEVSYEACASKFSQANRGGLGVLQPCCYKQCVYIYGKKFCSCSC
jgi:hypothetical protein